MAISCRPKTAPVTPVSQKTSQVNQLPPPDPKVTAAVGRMHDVERQWLEQSPEAAAAFKQLKEAQAAYQSMIEKFGLYTTPVRERDARLAKLGTARESGDPAAIRDAEKDFKEAADKVEEAEAVLRSGNPPIQQLYDKWLEARKTYADLRKANESISKASADVTQLMEKSADLSDDGDNGVKEN